MKINMTEVPGGDISKELSIVQGNAFEYQDVSEATQRGQITPKLLTALFGGSANETTLMTTSFEFDQISNTQQLPSGKRYDQKGPVDIPKDSATNKYYGVPSFGWRFNVLPKDWAGRRIPGTNQLMDEAYVVSQMSKKADIGWMLHNEIGFGTLLTSDTNIVSGGPFTQYNYYTDLIGTSRSSAVSMELDNSSADHAALAREQKKLLLTTLGQYGDTYSNIIVICGNTFFEQRMDVEINESFNREIRSSLDLGSMEVDTSDWGSSTFKYDYFVGNKDGLTYINYGAGITGSAIIGDTAAYMVPVGVPNFMGIAYAPAQTRSYANTEAQKRYSWTKVDEFTGVTMFQEENKLFWCKKPDLIRVLSNT